MDEAAFFASLPRKVTAAAALLRDARGRVLIVNPTYRNNWLLPGGTVDADESPLAACRREVEEEIGLSLDPGRLLCVDHRRAQPPRPESIHFTFDGGVLDNDQIARIRLPADELSEYRFVDTGDLATFVTANICRRIMVSLVQLPLGGAVYLEDLAAKG